MSPKHLSQILSLEISNEYDKYNGFYQYYLTANNVEILDGKFELEAQNIQSPNEIDHSYISYKGTYINGTKNGEFFQNFGQWEFSSQITLYYESSNQCSWGLFEAFSEGSEIIYKVDKPKSCAFSFIGEQANKYGKWTDQGGD